MYARILVLIDGSPTSESGLSEAIRIARATGARLRLMHLVDEWPYIPEAATSGVLYRLVEDEVKSWPADLVVLGSHGRRGISRVLIGSDAERILRHATTPVLVVRLDEAAEAAGTEARVAESAL